MTDFRIFVSQMNPAMGNVAKNVRQIEKIYGMACQQKADVCIFPELAVTGYLIGDLYMRAAFRKDCQAALHRLRDFTEGQSAVLIAGLPIEQEGDFYNGAAVFENGYIQHISKKSALARGSVFDDHRYFEAATVESQEIVTIKDVRIGLMICEDLWRTDLHRRYQKAQAQLLVCINASPFDVGKPAEREELLFSRAKKTGLPILYVNRVGAEDGVVYDGRSVFFSETGQAEMVMPAFAEANVLFQCAVDDKSGLVRLRSPHLQPTMGDPQEDLQSNQWQALMEGLRAFMANIGLQKVVLGLSGGIDSAVVGALAVDTLGPAAVHGILMPGPFSTEESLTDALQLVRSLGIHHDVVSITADYNAMRYTLADLFKNTPTVAGNVYENIQARLRAMVLLAWANQNDAMVLNTSNKSELAVGYGTLYGDLCGGLSILGDVYKTGVYSLAHWRNYRRPPKALGSALLVIPENTLVRPPSAELAEGQLDSDTLPPYDVLDRILELYIERQMPVDSIIAAGFQRQEVLFVVHRVKQSEFKRLQAPPIIKVSARQFGKDRRYTVSQVYAENSLDF